MKLKSQPSPQQKTLSLRINHKPWIQVLILKLLIPLNRIKFPPKMMHLLNSPRRELPMIMKQKRVQVELKAKRTQT